MISWPRFWGVFVALVGLCATMLVHPLVPVGIMLLGLLALAAFTVADES